ncbi:hypothetical protein RclHR1_12340007 [Rhizophagus clarus]|uniref:Crinkler effector protein N-terminal domain-containing protein n=1 Tax=Rhizophagus clarus TaxID=94130 RepID=A0A2Z6Q705_9GLOM|nr:hypothetical protein RclHR1_12340007 [Rhizophagus clarus]
MSITLLCLVKGNTTASAFPVDINKDQLVGHLKEAIKAKKHKTFHDVEADEKLWKKEIPDDQDDLLSNLTLNDGDELLATREIGDYWAEKPPKRHIHVLVSPPEATSNREQELLDQVTSLQALLNKSTHDFDVVVHPKRKPNKWTANIEHATLEGLKEYIRKMYQPPALENDGAELNLMNDGDKYSPRNDQDLREILRIFVSNKKLKFTVFIETPSKPFSDWSFPKVCQLYGISNDPNPDIDVFPPFSCGSADLNSDKSKAVIKHLMAEIKLVKMLLLSTRQMRQRKVSILTATSLSGVSLYKDNFKLIPEKLIEGRNGQGNLDYAVECRSTDRVLCVIEVKKEDFMKGFAQASVQIESTLSRKRKADEIDNGQDVDRVFGIVTDASEWYFMECSLDNEGKPAFKLSESVTVVYKDENLQAKVEKVLGHIVWILEEAQKPVEASQSGVKEIMSSRQAELEVLKQRIVELEAKNAKLEAEKAELLKRIMEENTRRDVRVEELEQKNKELETRLAIVEQASLPVEEQSYNDNPSDDSTSNFNSVAEYHEKPLVDVETDNSFPEEVCYNKQELVAMVPANSAKRLNGKPLEEKDMDSFLLEAHKKIVSSEIKQRNKEKKLSKADHRKKGAENIVQLIADGIMEDAQSSDKAILCDMISIESLNPSTDPLLSLAQLFDKADDAEYGAIRANQEEILRWYYYGKEFLNQVSVIIQDSKGKIGEKKAKGMVYDKMLEHLSMLRKQRSEETGLRLPEISRKNLQRKTQKAVKIYKIFEKDFSWGPGQNSSDDSKEIIPSNLLEDVDDYYKMILEECAKDCEYFDKKVDSTSQPVKETNEEVAWEESNEIKSDNDSDSDDSEEEMPDDSDDDGYNGYGGYGEYNEYGERDRGYYYRDGRYERKTSQ